MEFPGATRGELPRLPRRRAAYARPALVVLAVPLVVGLMGGCSSQQTQRASLEYRLTVLDPLPSAAVVKNPGTNASGGTAVSSVETD